MIGRALVLGLLAGGSYVIGGEVGARVLGAVRPNASTNVSTGAAWAGRVTTFVVGSYVLSRFGA